MKSKEKDRERGNVEGAFAKLVLILFFFAKKNNIK